MTENYKFLVPAQLFILIALSRNFIFCASRCIYKLIMASLEFRTAGLVAHNKYAREVFAAAQIFNPVNYILFVLLIVGFWIAMPKETTAGGDVKKFALVVLLSLLLYVVIVFFGYLLFAKFFAKVSEHV
jgi:hypothetical protein